ncbi:MAG TPA: HNH endonuclease [Reyranella sp.]|nr:HNH endonuclease [Reyranella sp.]
MLNLFIANTDNRWFDFLAAEPALMEVNFWWPGEMNFRAIQPGELLVFRLKSPRNKIGGYGVFSSHSLLPIQMAWDTFGRANGVSSFEALRSAIADYRGGEVGPNTNVGCTVLVEPVFFPPDRWIDLPESWSQSIQRGKLYSLENREGRHLWDQLQQPLLPTSVLARSGLLDRDEQARYGEPSLIKRRLGQGAFRVAVTEAYGRQCAISDGKVLPALDAAHIKPFGEGGAHTESNGILLRKDIHCVFDAGYVTIGDKFRFEVSTKIKEIFNNGEEYLRLHGKSVRLPRNREHWPNREFIEWHNNNRYVG